MNEDGNFSPLLVPGIEKITNTIFPLFEDNQGVVWMGVLASAMTNFETYKIIPGLEIDFYPAHEKVNLFSYNGIAMFFSEYGLESIVEGQDISAKFNRGYTAPSSFFSFHQSVVDAEGDIWLGTAKNSIDANNFLYEFGPDGSLKSSYNSFASDSLVYYFSEPFSSLKIDPERRLWICANGKGLINLDLDTRQFEYFPETNKGQFFFLGLDTKSTIWMNYQGDGVTRFFPSTGKMINYQSSPEDSCSISDNTFGRIFEDSRGTLWIGTYNGLNRWDSLNDCFYTYFKENGLSGDGIRSVLEDHNGDIWVSSAEGVSKYRPEFDDFINMNLPVEYMGAHGMVDRNGTIFLEGQIDKEFGVLYFHPDSIQVLTEFPKLVVLDFLSSSKENPELTSIGSRLHSGGPLELTYDQDIFSVHFTALEYHSPGKIQFAYRLDGFDQDWRRVGNRRDATYTNLDPGDYTFRLISTNRQDIWSEDGPKLQITILPPWWATWWAYTLYAVLTLALLLALYRYLLNRNLEKAETLRLRELDEVKTKLYTNITHEFRTPLTVIQGMAMKIQEAPQKWAQKGSEMVIRNSRHLLHLVNQMLDLSKLESGKLSLNLVQADVIPYLHYLVDSFHSFGETKGVSLQLFPKTDSVMMDYDPDRLRDVLSNLLSNALKFTPQGGYVYVMLETTDAGELQIMVKDTGIGIAEEKLPHIFDRFYQVDDSSTRAGEGTGIGLALTRELVHLMRGGISVQSEAGKGTTFTVTLPITRQALQVDPLFTKEQPSKNHLPAASDTQAIASVTQEAETEMPMALIIEDHADVVNYLSACLEGSYRIEVARNGQEGIEMALERIPDVIISDVMMPEKDGFEVCNTLKNDVRTSHIPLILLTAKADVESKIAGLSRGADAYLAKPFNEEELKIRMAKLLELRDRLRLRYSSTEFLRDGSQAPSTPETEPEDTFITQVKGVIFDYLDDPKLDVTKLCRELGMSRSPLHKKLKALTGMSTTEFIRFVRLTKASELLERTDMPVSEIAYKTGFQNHNYFSKRFGELFGMSPTEHREGERR